MEHDTAHRTAGTPEDVVRVGARRMRPLQRAEALRLLATVSLGRIVFTRHALPAVRPVNHVLEGEDILVRVHDGGALAALAAPSDGPGIVVAYEADEIDPATHLGWSVVVTGYASVVTDEAEAARLGARLRPWVRLDAPHLVRIRPDLVTGFLLEREVLHGAQAEALNGARPEALHGAQAEAPGPGHRHP
ncbi:pyridoxamine 5'-phosphate oxidase family protein [Streptomyces bambusae]|uniref:Pyridoxamine 5'-phosphate oxidase family protein n=2 Tax=Streptomyces bambusae TaxID=1550616 RepID=A0ABS6Z917_9ACTN|nr:pyridoxamine 5'-phosphate oxidase family protein [Streptomyces bambusae]